MDTLIFSGADLRRIVDRVGLDVLMDEVIETLTAAFREYDETKVSAPVRGGFHYQSPSLGLLEWMPVIEFGQQAVIKIVGYHPTNPARHQLPTILSVAMTFDVTTGHMLGMLDGTFLTALRTGAASAVASKILASPQSRVLGLIGAGAQAVAQFHALSRTFNFSEVLICDTDPGATATFAERCATFDNRGAEIKVASVEKVVTSAHILCTATSVDIDKGPVFEDALLRPSLHINAVGSDFPGKIEIPLSVLQRSVVFPDFYDQAVKEGECQQLDPESIGPNIVDLVKQSDRYVGHREALTVFDSTGWALEDQVTSNVLFLHGRQLGCGTMVDIESTSVDPKNPYGFSASALRKDRIISGASSA